MYRYLIDLHYLPSVAWFVLAARADEIIIEQCESYQKQTFRNRCQIRGAKRIESLIVPLTGKNGQTRITDAQIDYSQNWVDRHWRTIESAYRKAPYFEFYADTLQSILYERSSLLFDLNWKLLCSSIDWLGLNVNLSRSEVFSKGNDDHIIDFRNCVHPKNPERVNDFFKPVPYQQVFGDQFVGNMSIIDLIFCVGPGARDLLRASYLSKGKKILQSG